MNFERMTLLATAAFGLEGVAAAECKRLGFKDVRGELGGARFTGSAEDAFLANLRLRTADRVLIVLAERECRSFEELFQFVKSIAWEQILKPDAKIHVNGKCARSQLMSVRDCQSISKKAIIERLKEKTGGRFFPETGAVYPIDISVHADLVRVTLDTSGEALNRRGYRTWNGEAPLRETLAAALVELSDWRPGMRLHDPCCGTGTLLIEAAFREGHRAPGMLRHFACEAYPFFSREMMERVRAQVVAEYEPERIHDITGSDIAPEALDLANRHIRQAELSDKVRVFAKPLQELQLEGEPGVFLCNPPYGERLGDRRSCEKLYGEMRKLQIRHPGWSLCAISSDPAFERSFGRRADKKRRLYNGRLECEFLVYHAK